MLRRLQETGYGNVIGSLFFLGQAGISKAGPNDLESKLPFGTYVDDNIWKSPGAWVSQESLLLESVLTSNALVFYSHV
jgi:hypothetical protein